MLRLKIPQHPLPMATPIFIGDFIVILYKLDLQMSTNECNAKVSIQQPYTIQSIKYGGRSLENEDENAKGPSSKRKIC